MKDYVGNTLQTRGAEQYVLQGARGDGMHFLCVRNGLGLEAWISLDRAGDISRITFKGENMGYFSACGYVAPQYFDNKKVGFLKSFTAGFFTTCGLTAVGSPCTDDGEELPLHGTISNTPARLLSNIETDDGAEIMLEISDSSIFGRKLVLKRRYFFSYSENTISLSDKITNEGESTSPFMIMYHCNMGYPLLTENSIVKIPNTKLTPRDAEAEKYLESALVMEKPQPNFQERCYYYDMKAQDGIAKTGIFNPEIDKGVVIAYEKDTLPCFVEWKMMGKRDYVLGLEPANCTPDGRDVLRKENRLEFIKPDETITTSLQFKFKDTKTDFDREF